MTLLCLVLLYYTIGTIHLIHKLCVIFITIYVRMCTFYTHIHAQRRVQLLKPIYWKKNKIVTKKRQFEKKNDVLHTMYFLVSLIHAFFFLFICLIVVYHSHSHTPKKRKITQQQANKHTLSNSKATKVYLLYFIPFFTMCVRFYTHH